MADMQPVTEQMMNEADGASGGAYISERFRNPTDNAAAAPTGNYVVTGIFALVALVTFLVMLGLLYSDFKALLVA